jgi:hypothetical protein
MVSRFRRLIGLSLLAVYGGLALLGHAGMHALHGDDHHHAHGVVVVGHAHGHTHGHSGCSHHHGPKTSTQSTDPQSGEQHEHRHDGPAHDHDNCVICHHFAAPAFLFAPAALLNLALSLEQVTYVSVRSIAGDDGYVLPIRGPPIAAS